MRHNQLDEISCHEPRTLVNLYTERTRLEVVLHLINPVRDYRLWTYKESTGAATLLGRVDKDKANRLNRLPEAHLCEL